MHDAELNIRFRENCFDGIREPGQSIDCGNKDILDSTVFQFGHHTEPEFGAFVLRDPQSQQFLLSFHGNGQGQVNSFIANLTILSALDDNAVEIDNRIHALKGTTLPCPDIIKHGIGHATDQRFRDLDIVEFQKHRLHIPNTHTAGIHGNDFFVEAFETFLTLRN